MLLARKGAFGQSLGCCRVPPSKYGPGAGWPVCLSVCLSVGAGGKCPCWGAASVPGMLWVSPTRLPRFEGRPRGSSEEEGDALRKSFLGSARAQGWALYCGDARDTVLWGLCNPPTAQRAYGGQESFQNPPYVGAISKKPPAATACMALRGCERRRGRVAGRCAGGVGLGAPGSPQVPARWC